MLNSTIKSKREILKGDCYAIYVVVMQSIKMDTRVWEDMSKRVDYSVNRARETNNARQIKW